MDALIQYIVLAILITVISIAVFSLFINEATSISIESITGGQEIFIVSINGFVAKPYTGSVSEEIVVAVEGNIDKKATLEIFCSGRLVASSTLTLSKSNNPDAVLRYRVDIPDSQLSKGCKATLSIEGSNNAIVETIPYVGVAPRS